MARLIVKSPYFKGGGAKQAGGYLRYIATRERVEILPDDRPPTKRQTQLIEKLTKDFPDTKTLLEYGDYTAHPTKFNASQFLTLAMEENWSKVQEIDGYAGTGCPGTKATIALSLKAKELGADVLSIISPYFAAISQKEIFEHYKAIAEAVDLPIVMYNMPARTGNNIDPATAAELAKIPNIAGIKDSSGNWDNLKGYIEATKGMDFSVLSGNDSLILPALKEGGAGGITAVANIYPETMVSIYRRFLAGDIAGAEEAQNSIANIRACFKFGNPNTVTKKATNLNGNPVGPCRAPFCYLSDEAVAEIARTLEADRAKGMR